MRIATRLKIPPGKSVGRAELFGGRLTVLQTPSSSGPATSAAVLPDYPYCTCALTGSLTGLAWRTVRYSQKMSFFDGRVWRFAGCRVHSARAVPVRAECCGYLSTGFRLIEPSIIIPQVAQALSVCTLQQPEAEPKLVPRNEASALTVDPPALYLMEFSIVPYWKFQQVKCWWIHLVQQST